MEHDLRLGSTVWIEHKAKGDIYYKVKIILEKQPSSIEICRVCLRGQLGLMGHIIQSGLLDDKVYAVAACEKCCAVTAFIYHVPHEELILPEEGDCADQNTSEI